MRRTLRMVLSAVVLSVSAAVLLSSCGSDSGTLATARSGERGSDVDSSTPIDPNSTEICGGLAELSAQQGATTDDGPEAVGAAADQVRELAAGASGEVRAALEVFADLFDQMAALEAEGDGGLDAFGLILGQMMDPEVVAASETLTEFMIEECGIDPVDARQGFGLDPFDGGEESGSGEEGDPSDISLDDLDAIKDANEDSPWVDKVFSSSIGNNRSVQLAAPGEDDPFGGEQLSTAEAIEACEAVRTALEGRQPGLTVEVMNGETTVATGAAGVPCTAT